MQVSCLKLTTENTERDPGNLVRHTDPHTKRRNMRDAPSKYSGTDAAAYRRIGGRVERELVAVWVGGRSKRSALRQFTDEQAPSSSPFASLRVRIGGTKQWLRPYTRITEVGWILPG